MTATQAKDIKKEMPDLVSAIKALKESHIKQYPVHCLRASDIGFECNRYHFYNLTRWQDRPSHDVGLQMIFEDGDLHEKSVIRDLMDAGLQVVEQQVTLNYDNPKITGRIDAAVISGGEAIPLEIKSINPWDFASINSEDDIRNHKKHTIRKYYAQMQLYLLNKNREHGLFLFKCKQPTNYKQMEVMLDYEFAESLLKKAEAIYKAIADKTPPQFCGKREICQDCPYLHICNPPLDFGEGVQVVEDSDIQDALNRREELKSAAQEFKGLDAQVKDWAKDRGTNDILCGDYHIEVVEQKRKSKVPLTWEEKVTTARIVTIEKLETRS